MNLTEMLISAIIKRGILYEARNVDVEFDIPKEVAVLPKQEDKDKLKRDRITVRIKAEHMTLQIERDVAEKTRSIMEPK